MEVSYHLYNDYAAFMQARHNVPAAIRLFGVVMNIVLYTTTIGKSFMIIFTKNIVHKKELQD